MIKICTYTLFQIQYVFSHIVLQPQEVCDYLHYCNGSSKSAHNERNTLVLGRLSKMVDKVRRNIENLERPQLKHSLFNRESSLKEILSYKEQLVNAPMKSTERSNARKIQPSANGTITFLHLSDIHLDTMYKEVIKLHIHTPSLLLLLFLRIVFELLCIHTCPFFLHCTTWQCAGFSFSVWIVCVLQGLVQWNGEYVHRHICYSANLRSLCNTFQ